MKTVTFLLPGSGRKPAGGYKVVYEYANRLTNDNYVVNIVYAASIFYKKQRFLSKLKCVARYIYYLLLGYSGRNWIQIDDKIHEYLVLSLNERHVPHSNYYIATAAETSVYLNEYKIPKECKLYLIQGFENWSMSNQSLYETYCYGMKNIVVAKWLQNIVKNVGGDCVLINNGFDFNYFKKTVDYSLRNKFCISMLYHPSVVKGCKYGFEALNIVKKKYPQLSVEIFGASRPPSNLPDWMHYYRQPNRDIHNKIYNEAAIYLGTSLMEGWGLTVGEAMICGAAVVCTNNLGYKEMAIDGETALLSPIKDSYSLSKNIIRLIEDDELRYTIAEKGHNFIMQYTWDKSYRKIRSLLVQ